MRNSVINWTDHTFNPWQGCTRVSPGCKNCYAEALDKRNLHSTGSHWGPGVPRKTMSDRYWCQPLTWNRKAAAAGERQRVFCASMADVFDDEAPEGQRDRLWQLIRQTPNLDWLLLTKRPQNSQKYLPADWRNGYHNVWLGVSVENRQHGIPRIDLLRQIPAVVRFLSVEPLLEDLGALDLRGIHWTIIGGESGTGARPFDTEWAESILEQCRTQDVRVWVKQLGRKPVRRGTDLIILGQNGRPSGHADKFGDWPEELAHLCVRELPYIFQNLSQVLPSSETVKDGGERYLGHLNSELERLASILEPDAARQEQKLRSEFIEVERRLFLSRAEKGRILLRYKTIYGPRRLWTQFLKIIGLARQTSYDLMAEAESDGADCTGSVQSRPSAQHDGDSRKSAALSQTDRLRSTIERNLAKLPEHEQLALVHELAIRFGVIADDVSPDPPSMPVAKLVPHDADNLWPAWQIPRPSRSILKKCVNHICISFGK
jgi:protein gp37